MEFCVLWILLQRGGMRFASQEDMQSSKGNMEKSNKTIEEADRVGKNK